jgi:hypothetical protein
MSIAIERFLSYLEEEAEQLRGRTITVAEYHQIKKAIEQIDQNILIPMVTIDE